MVPHLLMPKGVNQQPFDRKTGETLWCTPLYLPARARPDPTRTSAQRQYVALGDSFSSGEGAYEHYTHCWLTDDPEGYAAYAPGTPAPVDPNKVRDPRRVNQALVPRCNLSPGGCHRSVEAYPVKVWRALAKDDPWSLTFVACSGAVIEGYFSISKPSTLKKGVLNPGDENPTTQIAQRSALSKDTDLVTLTLGGNDAGFAQVLAKCVKNADRRTEGSLFDSACVRRLRQAVRDVAGLALPGRNGPQGRKLTDLYDDIRAAVSPEGTKVVVLGYPALFTTGEEGRRIPGGCGSGASLMFSRADMIMFNEVVKAADRAIETLAGDAGFYYVNVYDILQSDSRTGQPDRTLCQDDDKKRGLNRFIGSDKNRSFHPTIWTYNAEAELALNCVRHNECTQPRTRAISLAEGQTRCYDVATDTSSPQLSREPVVDEPGGPVAARSLECFISNYTGLRPNTTCNGKTDELLISLAERGYPQVTPCSGDVEIGLLTSKPRPRSCNRAPRPRSELRT